MKQEELIRQKRWETFLTRDKDPYICSRFVIALEKLMPPHLSQIQEIVVEEGMSPTADRMIIETDPEKVSDRYLTRLYKDYISIGIDRGLLSAIRKTAGDYMIYLKSTAEERLLLYKRDKYNWQKYI